MKKVALILSLLILYPLLVISLIFAGITIWLPNSLQDFSDPVFIAFYVSIPIFIALIIFIHSRLLDLSKKHKLKITILISGIICFGALIMFGLYGYVFSALAGTVFPGPLWFVTGSALLIMICSLIVLVYNIGRLRKINQEK